MAEFFLHEFAEFYKEFVPKVYAFFYSRALNKENAEDLTEETFTRFVEHIRKNKEVNDPAKFIYGIARNVFTEFLKSKYKFKQVNISDEEMEFYIEEAQIYAKKTIEDKLLELLPHIPHNQSKVLELRFIQKLSISEIAQHLKKNNNYVKVTQRRGFHSIRKLLIKRKPTKSVHH